jgi:hypothetical protein
MDPIYQAERMATEEITAAFDAFFRGQQTRVPYVGCGLSNTLGMQYQPVSEAITDLVSSGTSKAALIGLLQGFGGDVAEFRKVLVADYIETHVEDIAQQRVEFDAPEVLPWLLREVA